MTIKQKEGYMEGAREGMRGLQVEKGKGERRCEDDMRAQDDVRGAVVCPQAALCEKGHGCGGGKQHLLTQNVSACVCSFFAATSHQ